MPRKRKAPDTLWHRLAPDLRAGSKLAHHTGGIERVFEEIPGHGRGFVGHIDHSQSLFQIGNEYGKLIYWPKQLISWGAAAWERVKAECEVVEAIDHSKNVCYRLTVAECEAYGEPYTNSHGRRFGVHITRWRKFEGPVPGPTPESAPPAPEPVEAAKQGSLFG